MAKNITATIIVVLILSINVFAQQNVEKKIYKTNDDDNSKYTNVGNIGLTVTNFGTYGHGFSLWPDQPSCEFPLGSGIEHIFDGGLWIGGFIGNDKTAHEFAGAVYHLDQNNALGVSLVSLHMDDMKVTTEFNPTGTGEYFTFGDLGLAVTYSRKMTDQFSIGGTIRYVEENMDKVKMRGVMVDLGTYYWTGLGTSRFAVTVSNFGNNIKPSGTVTLSDGSNKSDWQSFSPPTIFRIGFAFEPYMTEVNRVTLSAQLNHPNDNSENVSTGVEYACRDDSHYFCSKRHQKLAS